MNSLTDKNIIITGAASGIGCATAIACAAAGANVVATDIVNEDTIRENTGLEDQHFINSINVANETEVSELVQQTVTQYRKIDGLVNCAGIYAGGAAHDLDINDWQRVLDVNLTGGMLLAKHVVANMLKNENGGSLVNLASIYGMTGGTGNLPYNVSKGAILQLTRSMAADYGKFGIRVNTVSPGYIETPMSSVIKESPEYHEDFVNMHLLRRTGQADEVAAAIVFLLSDDASFISGVNLPVDGGFSAAHVPAIEAKF